MVSPSFNPASPPPGPVPSPRTPRLDPLPGAPTSPLPDLSPDDRALLDLLFDHHLDLAAAHRCSEIPVPELLLWSTRPDIQAHLLAYETARLRTLKLLAMATLQEVIASTPSPIEKRRAASALIRAITASSSPPRPPCPPAPTLPSPDPTARGLYSILSRTQAQPPAADPLASFTPSDAHTASTPNLARSAPPFTDAPISAPLPLTVSPSHPFTVSSSPGVPPGLREPAAPDSSSPCEDELQEMDQEIAARAQAIRDDLAAGEHDPNHPANDPAYRRQAQSMLAAVAAVLPSLGGSRPLTSLLDLPSLNTPSPSPRHSISSSRSPPSLPSQSGSAHPFPGHPPGLAPSG